MPDPTELEYNMIMAVRIKVFILIVFVVCLYSFGNVRSDFFHFGPANGKVQVNVFGCDINTWGKWFIVMIFLFLIEMANTWCVKRYKRWYGTSVLTRPERRGLTCNQMLSYIGVWKFIDWALEMIKWFITITNKQIQFLLPAFLASLLVNVYIDKKFIDEHGYDAPAEDDSPVLPS